MPRYWSRGEIVAFKMDNLGQTEFQWKSKNQITNRQGEPQNWFNKEKSSGCILVDPKKYISADPNLKDTLITWMGDEISITIDHINFKKDPVGEIVLVTAGKVN